MAGIGPPRRLLFVCVENSCRSQMAEGFARALGGERIEAYSAGSRPSGQVHPDAIRVMQEQAIDLSAHRSKAVQSLPAIAFDYVISMGCGDACPHLPAKRRVEWRIPDPKGQPLEVFRQVRDQIEGHVKQLLLMIQEMQNNR
ncbi:MAG: arsenate reductase ArsC [Candidatus Omnitrophica bacterium]|nr:arsenate reductase ArsC [Candidatus Omnitrophota bacterium]